MGRAARYPTKARATARDIPISAAFADAVGGAVIKEVTQGRPDGGEETETQVTPPNGRIALELLARMFPDDWRPVKAVEVSGPGGGAVQLNHQSEIVEGLVGRIAAVREKRGSDKPWPGEAQQLEGKSG